MHSCSAPGREEQRVSSCECVWAILNRSARLVPIKENAWQLCACAACFWANWNKMIRERRKRGKRWWREFMEKELLLISHEMEMSVISYLFSVR